MISLNLITLLLQKEVGNPKADTVFPYYPIGLSARSMQLVWIKLCSVKLVSSPAINLAIGRLGWIYQVEVVLDGYVYEAIL